ncbi:unnamed protein product [Amoebophrya sp. A25]|nr:unnamed protein product [Amoebophrya sp. A25]|eukprot:GSA25T00020870001.1
MSFSFCGKLRHCRRSFHTTNCAKMTSEQLLATTSRWVQDWVIAQRLCPFAKPLIEKRTLRLRVTNGGDVERDFENEARRLMGLSKEQEQQGTAIDVEDYRQGTAIVDYRVGDRRDELLRKDSDDASASNCQLPAGHLLHPPAGESSLLICQPGSGLDDFWEFERKSYRLCQIMSEKLHLNEQLQIVLFHPQAVHDRYSSWHGGDIMDRASCDMIDEEQNLMKPDDEGSATTGCTSTSEDDKLHKKMYYQKETSATNGINGVGQEDPRNFTIRSPFPTYHLLRESDVLAAVQSGYPQPEEIPARNAARFRKKGLKVLREEWRGISEFSCR